MNNNNKMEEQYIKQLTLQERKTHDIAKSHLGTSFNVIRSNGYKLWIKKQDSIVSVSNTASMTILPTMSISSSLSTQK